MKQYALCELCGTLALAIVLFTALVEKLRLYSSTEAGIFLNLFLNFEQK